MMRDYEASRSRIGHTVAAENPLAGALLLFETGDVTWDSLRSAIESATGEQLNKPVTVPMAEIPGVVVTTFESALAKPQSPLALALQRSHLDRAYQNDAVNPRFLEAARLMMARGAQLSLDEEQFDAGLAWMAEILPRGVALPDPRADQENPLAVRIISATAATDAEVSNLIHEYSRTRPELLSKPTTTYGTPLRAALVRSAPNHVYTLLYTGALLSERERELPSLTHALDRFLNNPVNASLRERYEDNLRKAAGPSPASAR
jgi:hypothetical protein